MKASAWVWIGSIVLLIAWDVGVALYRAHTGNAEPTLSMIARDWCLKHPWALLAVGILLGHFFFPQPPPR